MAHLMFEEFGTPESVAIPNKSRSMFDEKERSVILLSRTDPMSSVLESSNWRTRLKICFGYKMANRLADERLEALRCYAVILRVRRRVCDEDIERFLKAGFASEQAARLEQIVAPWRCRSRPGPAAVPWVLIGIALMLAHYLFVAALDEEMIALILTGLLFVLLAPLLSPSRGSA